MHCPNCYGTINHKYILKSNNYNGINCCSAAAVIVYWANAKLDKQLRSTAGTLLGAADGVQFEINHALKMVQVAAMFPISRQGSSHQFLQACFTLGRVFNKLQRKVKHSKDKVYKIFDTVYVSYRDFVSNMD